MGGRRAWLAAVAGAVALAAAPAAPDAAARTGAWGEPVPLWLWPVQHRPEAPAEARLGPEAAAAIARERTGGRVLRVRPRRHGAETYRVRILLPGGRVRTVVVDGRTGEVIE